MSYSPEQLELDAALIADCGLPYGSYKDEVAAVYRAYAATLRQAPAQGGVTEAMVEAACDAYDKYCPDAPIANDGGMRYALEAALSAEPAAQGEAVLIEAVGRVERDMTGELGINWLVEGGIHALIEGSVLLCSEHDHLTDDDGSATLYTAPPAQPAERVPEGWVLVPRAPTEAMVAASMIRVEVPRKGTLSVLGARAWEAMLTATPAPSEGGKGVDGLCIRNPAPNAAAPSTALSPTATVYLNAKDAR